MAVVPVAGWIVELLEDDVVPLLVEGAIVLLDECVALDVALDEVPGNALEDVLGEVPEDALLPVVGDALEAAGEPDDEMHPWIQKRVAWSYFAMKSSTLAGGVALLVALLEVLPAVVLEVRQRSMHERVFAS